MPAHYHCPRNFMKLIGMEHEKEKHESDTDIREESFSSFLQIHSWFMYYNTSKLINMMYLGSYFVFCPCAIFYICDI